MRDVHRLEPTSGGPAKGTVHAAWERFVQGEDHVRGVRPEVAISWHRCREQYRVDPHLTEAPVAVVEVDHTPEHDVVFAELGFRAASIAHEVGSLSGIVTVTDATGRILGEWGDPATLAIATAANLAPWFCWSECATGTNGMGTALEAHGPVLIRGAEHWCQAFHNWVCAGVAVRDVVTREPIAVLNISCWRSELPASAGSWLANAVTKTQCTLRRRARDSGAELVAAYTQARARSSAALAAVDTAGKVVIADETASVLMGVPASTPAVDPTLRWNPGLPELIGAARYASKQAARNPDWVGSTQIFTHLADEPTPITIRPVFLSGHLIGNLVSFGTSDGEQLPHAEGSAHPRAQPRRLVAMRDNRMVLLRLSEVSYAESEGNDAWLSTDQGRLRAASQGLDKLDSELADAGFLRVHRQYVVNLSRIREVERGLKGELFLVMDDQTNKMVPVSRRNAPAVRRALDI
ncbi:MAG: sigma-54 dependent transcriptional regulator, acetoin dehydrogenase operon transcriptional [Pseudonocardiales bacterium]|nr:sigma-54 dependent transcriptional regulator, acetoin dehydrogenase operon transcriptional [Pseudonocardiales bacterium]MDT7586334.1 sigma-54 dependent transcriptional regulator, acetoin dehydrogenase operon transcriptional [Pseudonocardiales bacterium]MDT7624648.1 sigma-54 dependent transcriptional regulator, acetoin dehydrogenase operon transcriptional [Pseudonocardiales bacterium]